MFPRKVDCEGFRAVEDSWPKDILRCLEFNEVDLLNHRETCEACKQWLKERREARTKKA